VINEWLSSYQRMTMTVLVVAAGNFLLARSWSDPPTLDDSEAAKETAWNLELPADGNLQGFHIILSASAPWGRSGNTSVTTASSPNPEDDTNKTTTDPNNSDTSVLQKTDLTWAFKGVIQIGRVRYVLLSDTKEGKITAYRESETLPDGSKVVAIGADHFTLRAQSETDEIRLFKLFHTAPVL
jgi:hypothetical protein